MANKFSYEIGFKRYMGFMVIECYYDNEGNPIGWLSANLQSEQEVDDIVSSIHQMLKEINPKNIFDLDNFPDYYIEDLHGKNNS